MSSFRYVLSIAVLAALALGYFASQAYALTNRAPEWTLLIDNPLVVWLSLLVFLGAIALSMIKEKA